MKNKDTKKQYALSVGKIQKYLDMLLYSIRKGIFRIIEK